MPSRITTITFPDKTYKKLKVHAARKQKSMAQVVRESVEERLGIAEPKEESPETVSTQGEMQRRDQLKEQRRRR